MNRKKLEPTKYYNFVGDIYEYHGPKAPKGHSTRSNGAHSDNGFRLRERDEPHKSFKDPLKESLIERPCPRILGRRGLYWIRDAEGPIYIGMSATCIHDRLWKYGPKFIGDYSDNKGVEGTVGFDEYRKRRIRRGYTNMDDIQVRFWFMDGESKKDIDETETYLLGQYAQKYGKEMPICNGVRKYRIDPSDI